jgi:flagellin
MAMVINTNVTALTTQRSLSNSQSALSTSMERLSTGLRINSAKDDAAGLGITDRMTSQIRGLNQAIRNAGDAISLSQTAESAMQESTNILQRMRELAIQSANDSNSALDRANLQKEVVQLQSELTRIAQNTTFNGKNILDGTFTSQSFHVGSEANESISVTVGSTLATDLGSYNLDGGTMTAFNADATANSNAGDADGLTITGILGTANTSAIAAGATASTVADAVNAITASTGVTANARTTATLDTLTETGTVSFTLANNNGGSVAITATVSSTSDLGSLADAINAAAASTGITATESGGSITLVNENGDDISIQNYDHSATGTINLTGGSGGADTLADGGTDDSTVGGQVTFTSSTTFSVEAGATMHDAAVTFSNVASIDIGTQTGSNNAIDVIDGALQYISDTRADLGAIQNRLETTISNLTTISENVSAARSRVQDADFAAETANMTRLQILQQAGVAMLSQANAQPQMVLSLLQ